MNSTGAVRRINRQQQKGATLLLVAGAMLVLVGMTAFAVDIGRTLVVKNELQNVSDSASLAGASRIGNFYTQNWSAACAAAKQEVQNNATEGKLMALGDAVIQYGVWDETAATPFTVYGTCSGSLSNIALGANQLPAVRVAVRRDETSTSGVINYFFAPIFGIASTKLVAESTAAVAASASAKPGLPFVMSDCIMQSITIPAGQPGAGGLKVGATFNVFSAQFDKPNNSIGSDKSIACSATQAVGQWAPFCTGSGCEGASKVKNLLENPDQAPVFKDSVILTDLKNGTTQSLFNTLDTILGNLPTGDKLTVLVPVVASSLIGDTKNGEVPLKDFISLDVIKVDKKKPDGSKGGPVPYIEFKVASPKKFVAGTPDLDGALFSGVITKAFLVK